MNVSAFFRRFGRRKQAPRTWSLLYRPHETQSGAPQPELLGDAPRIYSQHAWVYACVRAIAQAAASVPWRLWRTSDSGAREPADAHEPLARLLRRVNPRHSFPELIEATLVSLELTGNAYWALERDGRGAVAEIWPMRPDRVKIIPGRHFVEGYIYEANAAKVAFGPHEVVHFRYFSPADDFYGLSPLAAAADSIATDLFAVAYNQGFFRRGARPEGIITSQVELSEDELKRLRAQFEELYAGVEKAHRVMILGADLEWKTLGLPPADAQFLDQRRLSREEICAVFGVPPAVVGIYEYANYANAQLQRKLFWGETILPKLRRIAGTINEQLTPHFSPALEFEFETSAVPALQEDSQERAQVAATVVQRGIMTINEVRERLYGLPPVSWGDTWWAPGSLIRADAPEAGQAPPPAPAQATLALFGGRHPLAAGLPLPEPEAARASTQPALQASAALPPGITGFASAHRPPHPRFHAATPVQKLAYS